MNFNFDDKKRQIVILAIALIFGTGAAFFMQDHIKKETNRKVGELAEEFQARSSAEKQQMQQGFNSALEQMRGELQKAVEDVKKAAPKEEKKEEKSPPVLPLSTKMPPNKRAVTISIDPLFAVGGLINPGDFVDVIIDLKVPNPQKPEGDTDSVTSLVFQNIKVLAVGIQTEPKPSQKELEERLKSKMIQVSLAVSAEEAGLLTFAQSNGKITLSLRSPDEKALPKIGVSNWNSLSEFVEKNQGAKILSAEKPKTEEKNADEVKPAVQIFKSGIEY